MSANSIESLCERMSRLEGENRRLRRGGLAVLFLVACAAMVASNGGRHARQIEAERFVVKDASGAVRATLGVSRSGQPELALRDDAGEDQLLVRTNTDSSSSLELYQRGRLQAQLSGSASGPMFQLFDERGRLATSLYAWPGGVTGLALNREQGGIDLGVQRDGESRLRFSDPDGSVRGGWTFGADGRNLAHHPTPPPSQRAEVIQAAIRPATYEADTTLISPFGGPVTPASIGRGPALLP
jgi:hypothetical protein